MKKILRYSFLVIISIVILGFCIPQNLKMPVAGATVKDFNKNSFWFYPWGTSGTHKGIDVFANKGTPLHSATNGLVLKTGTQSKGGKYILILGPKWRVHYYAHLESIDTKKYAWVNSNTQIGTVGDSGNAKSKPPHLHYVIATMIPYPWRIDRSVQGWKKIFYLDPSKYLS